MIVCLCKGVSMRVVRDAVQRGARTVPEVARACSAGAGCGGCHQQIREVIGAEGGARVEAAHEECARDAGGVGLTA